MRTKLTALALLAALAGCGGDAPPKAADPAADLRKLEPVKSATVDATMRLTLDNAPRELASPLELRLTGPLQSNGPDRIPSLDWKIAFTGLNADFTSRLVSTGEDVFIRLGGQDFAVGEELVGQINTQAAQVAASQQSDLASVGIDPLAAVKDLEQNGTGRYTGTIDTAKLLDQLQTLLTAASQSSFTIPGATLPDTTLTPDARRRIDEAFSDPEVTVETAGNTLRRVALSTSFATPPEDQAAGITGGTLEYSVSYADVGEPQEIAAPARSKPLSAFMRELRKLMRQRG